MSIEQQLPSENVMRTVFKTAIEMDMPIHLDYWIDSVNEKIKIGIKKDESGNTVEKILIKNVEEYTSPIRSAVKLQNSPEALIIITENSIYLVSSKVKPVQIKK